MNKGIQSPNTVSGSYDYGIGAPEDDAEAVKWFRLAADQENEEAQLNLWLLGNLKMNS